MSAIVHKRRLLEAVQAMVKTNQMGPEHIVEAVKALEAVINDVSSEPMALTLDLEARPGWLPIASAPKDLASRLYRVNGFCVQGFVDATGTLCAQNDRQPWRKMNGKPTHWMPLPPSPPQEAP